MPVPIARVLDLVDPATQLLLGLDRAEAERRLLAADPREALGIRGSFALAAREGDRVCLARSLDRPLRYFLAKETDGPMLVVAERIDEIRRCLESRRARRPVPPQLHAHGAGALRDDAAPGRLP